MLALTLHSVKDFMVKLLKESVFDDFHIKSAVVETIARFEVYALAHDGEIVPCLWADMREHIYGFIKGGTTPRTIRVVLSADLEKYSIDGANGLYINIHFEEGTARLTTGISCGFSLDKNGEKAWDAAVIAFLDASAVKYTVT